MLVSESVIRETAHDIIHGRYNGNRRRLCDSIANDVGARLDEYDGVETIGTVYAPVQGRTHYVVLLPADRYAGTETDTGYVVIDPTIKQFTDQLAYDFPDVAVLPPGDDRRDRWYSEIDTPE